MPTDSPSLWNVEKPLEPFGQHSHEFSEMVIITGGAGVHITHEDAKPRSLLL